MIDDYDRRMDDRLEAGLCPWCGHAPHGARLCAVFLSGPAYRRPCKCGATPAPTACEFCGHAPHEGRMCSVEMPAAALHGECTCGAASSARTAP